MSVQSEMTLMDPIYDEQTKMSFTLRGGKLYDKPQYVNFLKAFVRKDVASIDDFVATKSYEEVEEALELLNDLIIHAPFFVCPKPIPPSHSFTALETHFPRRWSKL